MKYKSTTIEGQDEHNVKAFLLLSILNELAEGNRLKRLELKAKFPPPAFGEAKKQWIDGVEDQA